MIRQTAAIFLDSYRELNARRLFWITLLLSLLVAGSFALVGVRGDRLTVLIWSIPLPPGSGLIASPRFFYKILFVSLGVTVWLSWIATVLALVSTANIFPDLITGGAVDLVLCKPIGRPRLFLTKYLAGLLFVILQVSLFCLASFLVIGFRGGAWEAGIFLAVPIVVCLFSYLYSICVLLGLLTRSPVASLLLTIVAWFVFIGVGLSEQGLHVGREFFAVRSEQLTESVRTLETNARRALDKAKENGEPTAADEPVPDGAADHLEVVNPFLRLRRAELADAIKTRDRLTTAHRAVLALKTVLPKAGETRELLNRTLISAADLEAARERSREEVRGGETDDERAMVQASERVEDAKRRRPVWWVVGTSAAFEFVMLAIGGWIFARRDF